MNNVLTGKKSGKFFVLTCLVLFMQVSFVWAAEDIVGDWKMTMDFNGRDSFATLSIAKKADGTLTGKWGSSELSKVKFENGKLTFVRTLSFGEQEFTSDFSGTLKDDKITGVMSSDFGDMNATGVRKKPICPALGQWDINFSVMEQDIAAKLVISQTKDGKFEGKWTENMGEHTVSNIKYENGKLSLTRKSKIEDFEFESTYEGTIKGNDLTGTLKSEMGDIQANGKRFGAELIGTWEMTTTSDFGTRTSMMVVEPDLTGYYESFGGETPMTNLKLENGQLTFKLVMGGGDMTFEMSFKGKLDGKTIKGQMDSERGASEVTGKKVEKTKAATAEAKTTGN
ncbi:MAG: hypothetical protein JW715_06790 [Sedimentisphaerales bacterium]|nr:hypothetical protein [Sedimentisphaerales bacterium]